MNAHALLVQALVYLAAGVISVPIAKRLGLGSVLGYLIAGVLVGPFLLNLVGEPGEVQRFAEFGVVILLFLIWPPASRMPRPKSSTPQLLETTVRSFTPASRIAAIRCSGIPQRPKPPAMMVMPSKSTPLSASRAPSTVLLAMTPCYAATQHLRTGRFKNRARLEGPRRRV